MKNATAIFLISVLLAGSAGAAQSRTDACPVQGELMHWIADYCMLSMETDDEIAVSGCIAEELAMAPKDLCSAKLNYKDAMCRIVVSRDGAGTVEACMADRNFAGSTVRNAGVGSR